MRLRVTSIDEFQFLTCLKHKVWGSKTARFGPWKVGDCLVFLVDKTVAGLATVSGKPYESREKIWDNGLFPHRINLRFTHAFLPDNRLLILGPIRDTLMAAWGPKYGVGIVNQQLLHAHAAEKIITIIKNHPNNLSEITSGLEDLLTEAMLLRRTKKPKRAGIPNVEEIVLTKDEPRSEEEESAHLKAQHELIRLGRATGCAVWVASNDRNKKYKGNTLSEPCLKKLPDLGLSAEATKRISLIDIIWIRGNGPVCAFEVEETTQVYSGLLRMSDFISVVPALNLKLFVVGPKQREARVMAELSRPTFQKIGLSEYCRFVSSEALEKLANQVDELVEDTTGLVAYNIIETIAISLEQDTESSLQ